MHPAQPRFACPGRVHNKKYEDLKAKYEKILKENKDLKRKSQNSEIAASNPVLSEHEGDTSDEEVLLKNKSLDFRRTSPQNNADMKYFCPVCNKTFGRENTLKNHMTGHNKDGDWLCDNCSYQTNSEANLRDHKLKAHTKSTSPHKAKLREGAQGDKEYRSEGGSKDSTCNMCQKDFIYRIDLTKHIREEHKTYKQCRNLKTCTYAPKCRYNHNEYAPGTQICFECGDTFKTVHDLMKHRKAAHKVQLCKEFLKGNCGYSQHKLWKTSRLRIYLNLRVFGKPLKTLPHPQTVRKPVHRVQHSRNGLL